MRIAAVQTRPVPGDLEANLAGHLRAVERAASEGVDLVVFPELSLTGYEPSLAGELALRPDDPPLTVLQAASDAHGLAIGAGVPLAGAAGVRIGMALFRPGAPRTTFAKHHLHPDEERFFVPGRGLPVLDLDGTRLAFAICYEISVPDHPARAAADGASVYLASVAKSSNGVADAMRTLAGVAVQHRMTVVMANCVGPCDGDVCAGRSSAWAPGGGMRAQLTSDAEGLLVLDTRTGAASTEPLGSLPA